MDNYLIAYINITNLLSQAVDIHNSIVEKVDANEAIKKQSTQSLPPCLTGVGQELKDLIATYNKTRDAAIILDYLSGQDLYTVSNDFKLSKPAILRILKAADIEIRK